MQLTSHRRNGRESKILTAASCSISKSLHCEETSFVGAVSGVLTMV